MASPVATAPLPGAEAESSPALHPRLAQPELSVVIKALNEAEKIEACLRSVMAATDPATTEIIVADSLSEDATVAVASRFPVKVVQLARVEDRGCGSAAQLGFQYARGKRLLLLDGDMELDPGFLPEAHAALDADPKLAGVAGMVVDRVMTLEFRRRKGRQSGSDTPGIHDHLNGGGLFRMEALRPFGYFTDRNLHACEELELGIRLTAAGWKLRRLDRPSVYHYGHSTAAFPLLFRRWKTRYLHGHGEIVRAKLGTKLLRRSMRGAWLYCGVILWWLALIGLLAGAFFSPLLEIFSAVLALVLAVPILAQCWRKRSAVMGLYSVALINFHAAGMIVGFLTPRIDPRQPIDSIVRHPES
ncbi:glycosyltransferase family 2 protein [Dongia sp. agr-C8]